MRRSSPDNLPVAVARRMVFERDGWWCIAPRLDPEAGPCYDRWGAPFSGYDPTGANLEMDRVREEATAGKSTSHADPTANVALCAGHHRGTGPNHGRQWGPAHRSLERQWLGRWYGNE